MGARPAPACAPTLPAPRPSPPPGALGLFARRRARSVHAWSWGVTRGGHARRLTDGKRKKGQKANAKTR